MGRFAVFLGVEVFMLVAVACFKRGCSVRSDQFIHVTKLIKQGSLIVLKIGSILLFILLLKSLGMHIILV